jgi:ribonuclease HI
MLASNHPDLQLRAAIAALEHTDLVDEGWCRITVVSHNAPLIDGTTGHIADWQKQNWREVASGEPIKNRDLWERLLDLVNEYASEGVQVRFWLVGHISNKEARKEARKVSKRGQTRKKYTRFPANGT